MGNPYTVIDEAAITTLKELDDGQPATLLQLLDLFFEVTPKKLEAIGQAIRAGDAKTVFTEAHGLKSSCRYVGALTMANLCEKLESMGKQGELTDAPIWFKDLEREAGTVFVALKEIHAQNKA
ncbi:MAG: Hpt domain-containing protein [Bacteriovoracia bacterium]